AALVRTAGPERAADLGRDRLGDLVRLEGDVQGRQEVPVVRVVGALLGGTHHGLTREPKNTTLARNRHRYLGGGYPRRPPSDGSPPTTVGLLVPRPRPKGHA